MMYWIKRGGKLFGAAVFFSVLISMMIHTEAWRFPHWVSSLGCAAGAGIIGWFIGTIICDILLKGICADIGEGEVDAFVEGGIMQRIHMMNEQQAPGGMEMPFVDLTPVEKSRRRTKKK